MQQRNLQTGREVGIVIINKPGTVLTRFAVLNAMVGRLDCANFGECTAVESDLPGV